MEKKKKVHEKIKKIKKKQSENCCRKRVNFKKMTYWHQIRETNSKPCIHPNISWEEFSDIFIPRGYGWNVSLTQTT
jgi:hypothetical protein